MSIRIQSTDVAEFEVVAVIDQPGSENHAARPVLSITHTHDRAGQITVSGRPMPGMFMAAMNWRTADDVIIEGKDPVSENININFQTKGYLQTRFNGLHHDLDMKAGRHNLVFTPDAGEWHRLRAHDELEMLHISINRSHFRGLIGTEGAWCERVLHALEAGRPFSGIHGTGCITPAMQRLIHTLRRDAPEGPMHNLLQQSRLLELLALQMEQFVAAATVPLPGALSRQDAEKLQLLKAYLDVHFLEELSLTRLARLSLLNEFKLKKGFKQLFGTTVFGYLKCLRMNHAAQLLRDHRALVEEVAGTLGYEHAHHFSAAFKKHFGRLPSEWAGKKTA